MSKPRIRVRAGSNHVVSTRSSLMTSAGAQVAYEAAGNGRRTTGWHASAAGPNAALLGSRPTLVKRSRDLVRQDAYAKSAIRFHVDQAVGTGIKAAVPFSDLDKLWKRFVKTCDPRRQLNFYGLQRQALQSALEGGDAFARLRWRRMGDRLPVPLQIQLLESELVPSELNRSYARGNYIVGGIEYNGIGQPVAFHMYRNHPGDGGYGKMDFGQTVRVPAEEVLHLLDPTRPGQTRGEPLLAQAITRLYDFHRYEDAELVRKLFAAYQSEVLYTPGTDEDEEQVGADDDGDGVVSAEPMEPGTTRVLPPGYQRDVTSPAEVGGTYEAFVKRQLMAVAAAAGVPYGSLSGDWNGLSDRTIRQIMIEFRRRLKIIQSGLLIHQFCQPVFERFVDAALLSGAWQLPEGYSRDDVYDAVEWRPDGFEYLHPVQEVDADRKAIRSGLKSRRAVIAERGEDPERVAKEIADDNAQADALGLVLDSDPRNDSGARDIVEKLETEDDPEGEA